VNTWGEINLLLRKKKKWDKETFINLIYKAYTFLPWKQKRKNKSSKEKFQSNQNAKLKEFRFKLNNK